MPASRTRSAVAAVIGGSALAAGCAHTARPAPPEPAPPPGVTVSACGTSPQAAPVVLGVICNTDDLTGRDLAWRDWGAATATAAGTGVVDLCAYDDCHTGAFTAVPVRLTASGLTSCAGHTRAYTRLHYEFPKGSPWPDVAEGFKTGQYIAAPGRPLPPPSQTVTFTCR